MAERQSELAFVEWVRLRIAANPRVPIGPCDDAAAIDFPVPSQCLVTSDMLLDGTCFKLEEAGPLRVGRKAMAVNLSDIAAMAGVPLAALVSVALPQAGHIDLAKELFVGMESMAQEFSVAIVGGDTNIWNGPLAISVTMLGEATQRGAVRRNGAKAGDWIFVSGPLGGSISGHHLDFMPRVREALELHRTVDLHSMIDISDGLARDLSHIVKESGCGAIIRAADIPVGDAARQMNDARSPLEHALGDGEDFELLFTVSPEESQRLATKACNLSFPVFHIGECVEQGMWLDDGTSRCKLEPMGYEHRFEVKS